MFRRVSLALVALVVALTPATVFGQAGTSTIAGIVRDSTDAPLPGAVVKVTNEDTGVTIETVSNGEGLYRVPALVPGKYRVEASLDGFERVERRSITLEVRQTLNRTNYNLPGFTLGAGDFGVLSSARPARTIQLGARFSF